MTTTVPPDDEVPRDGAKRRRAEIACVTGIAVKTVFALALLPLTPSLLGTDPVLLEALRGSTSAMASGGAFARVGEASLVLAVLAPLPTLLFATPFFWWAGRLVGSQGGGRVERWPPERGEMGAAVRRSPGALRRDRGRVGPVSPGSIGAHLRGGGLDRDEPPAFCGF